MASGDSDKAYSVLKDALSSHPKDHQLLTTLSTLLVERGDYQLAESILKPIVDSGSLRRELRYAYALALRGLARPDEAKTHFDYAALSADEIAKANQLIPMSQVTRRISSCVTELGDTSSIRQHRGWSYVVGKCTGAKSEAWSNACRISRALSTIG